MKNPSGRIFTNPNNHTCLENFIQAEDMYTTKMSMDIDVNILNETGVEVFDWNETQVGWIQSSYFIGYTGTMVIGANAILKLLGQFKGMVLLLILNLVVFASCKFITFLMNLNRNNKTDKMFSFDHDDKFWISRSHYFSNLAGSRSRPGNINHCGVFFQLDTAGRINFGVNIINYRLTVLLFERLS